MDEDLYAEEVIGTTESDGLLTINPMMLGLDGAASFTQAATQPSPHRDLSLRFTTPDDGFRSSPPPARPSTLYSSTNATTNTPSTKVYPPRFGALPQSTLRSGLIYSSTMRLHAERKQRPTDEAHPEDPRRIQYIFQELVDAGLAPDPHDEESHSAEQLQRLDIHYATEEQLCLVHTRDHVDFIKSLEGMSWPALDAAAIEPPRESVYFNTNTWQCAQLSAGGAIDAARAVVSGTVKNAFAVIRPPGHHAEEDKPGGFCMFNNVPIAARVVQQEFPETCRKILILDWDVHHGNGIQRTFYDDPNVLYISLHVSRTKDGERFYPQNGWGDLDKCGKGPGLGKNINIAWQSQGMTDADYIFAFQQIVMPVAIEFDPDLVMVSAGFDAAADDPLGQCFVSPAGYGHMTYMLMQLAGGKVVACLEGGYNLRAISRSALAMTRVLMGEPPDRILDATPTLVGVKSVRQVMRQQSRFWKCLYPKARDMQMRKELKSERLHDVIREWQSGRLWKEHNMSQLFILRQKLSKSFEDQVLATPNYHEERPLLVIFHDPPEALGYIDVRTNQLELHNTWLTDVSKTYVDWATQNDFAVIDVNIPKHLTDINDTSMDVDADSEAVRATATRDIALYLWRNYIETSDCTHLFLIGIGDAYVGITRLLSDHAPAVEQTDHTFGFVAENSLRSLSERADDLAILRFYQNSSIYVSQAHNCFDADARKMRRKHGKVWKSEHENLQEMLHGHHAAVVGKMAELTKEWREENAKKVKPLGSMAGNGNGNGVRPNGGEEMLSASSVVNGSLTRKAGEVSLDENAAKRARNGLV